MAKPKKYSEAIHIFDKPIEEPWAYATRQGFVQGKHLPGDYYRYFATKAEAEKSMRWMESRERWHGPLEYRPGESRQIGWAL